LNVQKSFQEEAGHSGALYLVATPIGNLEDMTFRAVRILQEADWIAAEDTRQTRKLLTHYGIHTRLISYHEHNKAASGPELVRRMQMGEKVALVSDAGTPAISDPGADLVKLAVEAGIAVIPIPGASASLAALVMSGLPTDRFTFLGFLPRERSAAVGQLQRLTSAAGTVILFESPYRVKRTLAWMREAWGDVPAALVRELTKKYEEAARGSLQELSVWLEETSPQGEYCILADLRGLSDTKEEEAWWAGLEFAEHVSRYESGGLSRKEAIKRAAADRKMPKRELYNALQKNIPEPE
jgi:16S rRNA (cytidine1402-2'-O)-methyltransferase